MEGEKIQETIYTGPQATSDIYYGSYKIICLGPKRLMITQNFGEKSKLSSDEKILAYFISYYRL